ncbi:MAG: Nitroreductase-like protein [Candidatus Syntrophoarchaeum caldarius]|uniref:Nitroreductase-like protein n=1 Tax=Candidatus Syntropharchaeum caldarium TaxID=1838285 RepID=A0A1F2P912_9EURY|nr:MAG: Nitroreductase-like protein [Candidatus Syntrophoarchaeum caldarius]
MELIEAIKGRRSIRKYTDEPVTDEELAFIFEAARWAPSWANTQCWAFIVVRDPATREKLGETLTTKNPARKAFTQAPVVIVACAEKGKSGYYDNKPATERGESWFMFDVALATHNLMLAAYSIGLGTVHVGLFDYSAAEELLEVPPEYTVVELIPLGHPAHEGKAPPRKEVSEFVFYERLGESTS